MRTKISTSVLAATSVLIGLGGITARAQTHTANIPPSADTFLNVNTDVDGALDTLNTYTWPDNQIANAILMQFDLARYIPAGSTITSAQLNLYLVDSDSDTNNPTYTITTHKLINFNPNLALATGYLYDGTNPWTDHPQDDTCCNNAIPLAQSDITAAYSSNQVDQVHGFKNWDLTTLVKEWISSPDSNYGVLLNSDPTKLAGSFRFFASSEYCDPSILPSLQVTYTGGAPLITPPTVSLTSPANGAVFTSPASITLSATAADSDGTISKVDFYQDCVFLVGTATNSPYSVTVNNLPPGSYRFMAKATDNSGATTASSNVVVTVNLPPLQITIGETAIGPLDDNGNGDLLLAQQASLPVPATVQSMSFYATAAAGNLRLGIYDASGPDGDPGVKKAEIEMTPVVGWNIANVTPPVALPAGNYWLAYFPSTSDLAFRKIRTEGTTSRYYSLPYGALPDTFETQGLNTSISHWTLYATLTTTTQTVIIGNINLANRLDSGNGNLLASQKASLSQTATLQSLSFYVGEYESGNLRLGLYDATATNGLPGALLASTPELTPANGWNTANVVTPVVLAPGDYWLAYLPSDSTFKYPTMDGVGLLAYHPYDYSPMPNPFGDLTGGGTIIGEWLFYATLTTSAQTSPTLAVARAGNNIVISYPAAATDFALEFSGTLSTPTWAKVTTQPVVVGDQATVTVQPSGSATFYRLRK